jgi:hypothetical protein
LGLVLVIAGAARSEALDLRRYMPVSEIEPGMTGIGKTTLEGNTIVEFQIKVRAVMKNSGPKRDMIVVQCSGAGLEQTGVVAGMSGSPVFIGGRLIGAVAYSFPWCRLPLAGVQPIEQMLRVTEESVRAGGERAVASALGAGLATGRTTPDDMPSVPVAALGLPEVPAALAGRDTCQMQPIRTPVMVSGISARGMERLRENLAPFGMVPMQGAEAGGKPPIEARLEAGAPMAIPLLRGDMRVTTMGTITEIVGDRLYAFGHPLFGFGEVDLPLMTGLGSVVIPTLMNSFRLGAPAQEVGRLVCDEETAVLGRLVKQRAPSVPITIKVLGPAKGHERTYRCDMIHHRLLSPRMVATAVGNGLTAESELPMDHTIKYRLTVKPVGREPIVRDNLAVSPGGDMYIETQARSLVTQIMDNQFAPMAVESVDLQATVEAVSHMAEIQEVRPLRNAVRPGEDVAIEMKIKPWRAEPVWTKVDVKVPADYPDGTCRVTLCGADDALRQEQREAPARFRPDDADSLLALLKREERRDQLFIRTEVPGAGLAIGREELPNLPGAMRTILADSAKRQVTPVAGALVTRIPVFGYVLPGGRTVEIAVNRKAPAQ